MASSTGDDEPHEGELRLWPDGDAWVARDVETGITSQGSSREDALANLEEAIALHRGDIGHAPSDEELRDLGIDPADNETGEREPPDVLD